MKNLASFLNSAETENGGGMGGYCLNHPNIEAISFCHSCKGNFCADCLEEGVEYYFCKEIICRDARRNEIEMHLEVAESRETDIPKILIDGRAATFCNECIHMTLPSSVEDASFSVRHSTLKNEREPCGRCGSVIMDLERPIIPGLFFSVESLAHTV